MGSIFISSFTIVGLTDFVNTDVPAQVFDISRKLATRAMNRGEISTSQVSVDTLEAAARARARPSRGERGTL